MSTTAATTSQIDVGLRSYMLGVYNHMTTALLLTGFFAYATKILATTSGPDGQMDLTPLGSLLFNTPLQWVVMLAPLGMVFWLSARIQAMSANKARNMFYLYGAMMGVALSSVLMVYTGASVARAFFITAGAFAGLSLYGYTTKRSLSAMGSFMVIGLFGLILASIVNIFMASTQLEFVISIGGVLIFAGLSLGVSLISSIKIGRLGVSISHGLHFIPSFLFSAYLKQYLFFFSGVLTNIGRSLVADFFDSYYNCLYCGSTLADNWGLKSGNQVFYKRSLICHHALIVVLWGKLEAKTIDS